MRYTEHPLERNRSKARPLRLSRACRACRLAGNSPFFRIGTSKQKAARRRLLSSNLMIVDQAALISSAIDLGIGSRCTGSIGSRIGSRSGVIRRG